MSAQLAITFVWTWTATTEMLIIPCSMQEAGLAVTKARCYTTGWSSQRETKTTIYHRMASVHGIQREAGGTTTVIWPASVAMGATTRGITLRRLPWLYLLTSVAWWLNRSRDRHCCASHSRTVVRECFNSKYARTSQCKTVCNGDTAKTPQLGYNCKNQKDTIT